MYTKKSLSLSETSDTVFLSLSRSLQLEKSF